MNSEVQKAVYLDRDGTIIEHVHYINDPNKVKLISHAGEGLRLMREKGYLLYVISNQSGVARGLIDDEQFKAVHEKFCDFLKQEGVEIAEFCYCFHHPDDKGSCRKPNTGLVAKEFNDKPIDLSQSVMVGDNKSDLQLAHNFGGKAYLVRTGDGEQTLTKLEKEDWREPYEIADNLLEIAKALP